MVVWIIGLSGAGKTTLATRLVTSLRARNHNVVHIDGDKFREIFQNDLGYTKKDRLINATRIGGVCKLLNEQGVHVVCSVLALYESSRAWMRENIDQYYEVHIDIDVNLARVRNSKNLYFKNSEIKNVNIVGLDIAFETPKKSDLVFNNNFTETYLDEMLNQVLKLIQL